MEKAASKTENQLETNRDGAVKTIEVLKNPDPKEYKKYPWLKQVVVATSFTPFKQLYIALYKATIWYVARQLAKDDFVGAIYLRHGCARGEIEPGISDIDLVMVLCDGGPSSLPDFRLYKSLDKNLNHYRQRYRRLALRMPLLDKWLEIYVDDQIEQDYLTGIQDRYRLTEGRTNYKLLYGQDYLAHLPDLPPKIRAGGQITRLQDRWALFRNSFIDGEAGTEDQATINSILYRYCCDLLKYQLDFRTGKLHFKRAGIMAQALPHLAEEDRAFVEFLVQSKARRFKGGDRSIIEQAKGFIFRQFEQLHGSLRHHAYAQPLLPVAQRFDWSAEERFPVDMDQITELLNGIEQLWGNTVQGAYLAPTVFLNLDDQSLFIHLHPQNLPTVEQFQAAHLYCIEHLEAWPRPIQIFLLLPSAAFYFSGRSIRSNEGYYILPQLFIPDLFTLLQRPECTLRPSAYPLAPQADFTVQAGWFFWSRKLLNRQWIEACGKAEIDGLEFVRRFWKCLQLIAINRSIETGQIVYPLTLAAIERALDAADIALPPQLRPLAEAYSVGVAGDTIDSTHYIAQAQAYLRRIDPGGEQFTDPPPWLAGDWDLN